MKKIKIRISKEYGRVSALYNSNDNFKALLVLSHGAGAGMDHPFMESLSSALLEEGIASLRFNFLYMENGSGPDRPKKAHAAISEAIKKAEKLSDGIPIFLSGKSFGGRMSSLFIAENLTDSIKGLIYYGFPQHAPH